MNKKRVLVIIIFFIIIIGVMILFKTNINGYTCTDANGLTWYFTVSNGKAINVYLYSGNVSSLETLEIPSVLSYNGNDYPVVGIRGYTTSTDVYYQNRKNILYAQTYEYTNSNIKKVVIPDTVNTINTNTFAGFESLTKVVTKDSSGNETEGLPQKLKVLGEYAFHECGNLEMDMIIPDTVTTIGMYCFYNNLKLKSVTMGQGVTNIPEYCFYNCIKLNEVVLTNALKSIGNYSFSYCRELEELIIPDSVTSVGNNAFSSCVALKKVEISKGMTTISNYMFQYCNSLEKVEIPDNITMIGQYAFRSCGNLQEVKVGTGVRTILNNAFSECSKLEKINMPDKLVTIGNNAFSNCSSLKGDIIVPDSVTSLGAGAFSNCNGIDGLIRIGNGVKTLQSNTLYNCVNAKKIVLGSGITSLESNSCRGITDIWIENTKENVSVAQSVAGGDAEVAIHWMDCNHKVKISTPSNVKIINTVNNEEIITNSYSCDTTLKFKVVDSKKRNNLILTIVKEGNYDNATVLKVEEGKTYKIDRIIADYEILVQDISVEADLSLRTYISQINRVDVHTSREPIVVSNDGTLEYRHTKYPLVVKKGDLITFKFRVYNEGGKSGQATELNAYIPKGLKFVSDNRINEKYNWEKVEDGKLTTDCLKNTEIKSNKGNLNLDYKDVELILEVTEKNLADKDKRLVVLGEIGKQSTTDADSTPGNESVVSNDYKEEESNNSTTSSYIVGNEDDDDFDSVIIIGKIKVDYTIKINKIDSETGELLSGAKFNLLNSEGEVIKTTETTKDGTLDFGVMTTYGSGKDVYYIEEVYAPEGYTVFEKSTLKVTVEKTLENEETREYSVKVSCDVLDYSVDTTRHEYTPIYTKEQLAKVGSGETITIDGVNYKYEVNSNYKLMSDIDLDGEQWVPISNEVKGILDGNGHKISNLTITSDEEMLISEIGLFRSFSGIVQDLELENVNIDIKKINKDAESISGHPCVGAFTGFMGEGTIKNCMVSGNITAATDNIGGFIGHTAEEKMVRIQKSINNANVTGKNLGIDTSNVGGFIGCALGAVSVTDCTNNGKITATKYNAGGIVGYVKATDYHEVNIKADFSEEEKLITLVVENNKTEGQYAIEIENLDAKTLGLIEGAKYTILDKDKNVMPNCEEVTLQAEALRIATVDIKTLGVDTYYIKELEPANGYNRNTGIIKLEVRRYWDSETENFMVSVNTENLTEDEVKEDKPKEQNEPSSSSTGEIFAKVDFENISWNVNKAEFVGCTNNGMIISNYMNSAGIVGTAHCIVNIKDCINKGEIYAYSWGNAAGIIAELRDEELVNYMEISNCKNEGIITSPSNTYYGSSGAIAANIRANLKIENTENTGRVTGTTVSGCIADFYGTLYMKSCVNKGLIYTTSVLSNYNNINKNATAGGLLAKNYVDYNMDKDANELYIEDCENAGDIYGDCHTGGIVGSTTAKVLNIKNCNVDDCKIVDISAGDKGGIVGFASVEETIIMNCNVDSVEMERTSPYPGVLFGTTGGILGQFCYSGGGQQTDIKTIKVINCKVTNSDITTRSNTVGGIIGGGYGCSEQTIEVYDSIVDKCNIVNKEISEGNRASGAAGILGKAIYGGAIKIDNCLIRETNIEARKHESIQNAWDQDVGGLVGISFYGSGLEIANCDVLESNIVNQSIETDSCANAGGLVGCVHCYSYTNINPIHEIKNCNIVNSNIETNAGNLSGVVAMSFETPDVFEISNCNLNNVNLNSTANVYRNSATGGIVGNMQATIKISDCNVFDSNIEAQGRTVGGILAEIISSDSSVIERCKVYNTTIKNNVEQKDGTDAVGGIAAYVRDIEIKDCEVDESTIYGYGVNDAAALIGVCDGYYTSAIVKKCKVTDTEITSESEYDTAKVSGMLGTVNTEKLEMYDCLVENCTITGKGKSIGSAVALGKNAVVNDISVNNVILNLLPTINGTTNSYNYNKATGGVLGVFTNEVSVSDVDVQDITFSGETGTTGGIIGFATTLKKMENCSVKDITIENTSSLFKDRDSIGGLIGVTTNANGSIKNNTVSNMTVETEDLNVGGIMGFVSSNNETKFENCDVSNINVINKNECTKANDSGHLGGILGVSLAELVLNDCDVTKGTLEVKLGTNEYLSIGGLIGYSFNSTANNCDISNVEMLNKTNGHTGGLVGMTHYNSADKIETALKVSNSTVGNNSIIKGGSGHTAGLLGFGKIDITSAGVDNTTVESTSHTAAGIIAHALLGSKVENADVSNSTIKGADQVGGIAGYSASDITNCDVSKTNISTISNNGVVGGIVGMIPESSSEIKDCTVSDSSNITGINGYIGGIAGFANNTINNCEVSDSTIKATGDSAYGLGGIVGHGSNYDATSTYVKKCSVSNCEIAGLDAVGGIAGAAVPFIEECTVDGEEIVLETTKEVSSTKAVMVENIELDNNKETETEKEEQSKDIQEAVCEEKTEEIQEDDEETKLQEIVEKTEIAEEKEIEAKEQTEKVQEENKVQILTEGAIVNKEYTTKISGRKYIGGIIGMGGQLFDTNTYVTITDCILRGIQVSGTEFVEDVIGRTSYYDETETTVYDKIINMIKENIVLK